MKGLSATIVILIGIGWSADCRAEDKLKTRGPQLALPTAKHARTLSKKSIFITVRVHRNGQVDLDTSQVNGLLKVRGYSIGLVDTRTGLSLAELKTGLRQVSGLYAKVAKRAGRVPTLKNKHGGWASTLEIRYEFDRELDLGRAAWVLTLGSQCALPIGWVMVRSKDGAAPRGVSADEWRRIAQVDFEKPATNPVLATIVMLRANADSEGKQQFRFAGQLYSDRASILLDVKSAGEYVRKKHRRKFAVAVVASSMATVQKYVDLASGVASTGGAELVMTPITVVPKAARAAKLVPMAPRAVLVLDVLLALEFEEEVPEEAPEAKLAPLSEKALHKALAAFPVDSPKELSEWTRPSATGAKD